jgi:Mg-chelatase subunit ChlD
LLTPTKVDPFGPTQPPNTMAATMNQNFLCPITQAVMTDPVIGSDGITYERSAIEQWFAIGHTTSPVTRAPMTSQSLVPNYALKALIEEGGVPAPPVQTPAATAGSVVVPLPPTIQVAKAANGLTLTVSAATAPDATLPTVFIDVLDISGSMGGSSMDMSHGTTSDAAAFSRADLVRHSVATQIELLRPQDELAVILFDNNATVALPPISMKAGTPARGAAKAILDQIEPRGGTNIWTGLHRALELAASADAAGKNTVIILQTDGESDPSYNPPRGIVPTLQAWLDAHPTVRPTIHTVGYGFGRALDMPLLRQIASVGRGTVNYIPDGSMVGTVFIHMLANLMSVTHRELTLSVPELGWFQPISFLQSGQTREFFLPTEALPQTFTVALRDHTGPLVALDVTDHMAAPTSSWAHIRYMAIGALTNALHAAETGDFTSAVNRIQMLTATTRAATPTPLIAALLTDLEDPDPSKGQIGKAFASADAFSRWGRHYVPSYLSGLEADWCINFKDALSQIARSPQVSEHIQRGDDLFNSLPPPRASCARYATGYGGGAAAASLATMASIHNSSGVCFLGASRVKMADGTEKRCDAIKPGDVDAAGYRIRCVLRTLVTKTDIVRVGADHNPDGGFTLWHPVFVNNKWQHPADIGTVETVYTDALYNFVLEKEQGLDGGEPVRPGVLIVDGVMTCTLGHGFTGPVIGHDYFGGNGSDSIIADLSGCAGWADGYVTWATSHPVRDPITGHIVRMDFTEAV